MSTQQQFVGLQQYYEGLRFQAGKDAYKYTCHIFNTGYRVDLPSSWGSGVFVEIDDNFFLFTAAHVVDDRENDIFIGMGTNEKHVLKGDWVVSPIPDNLTRCNDKIDAAVLKLDTEQVGVIQERYVFLSLDEIKLNHTISDIQSYVGVGFPGEWNYCDPYFDSRSLNDRERSTPLICAASPAPDNVYTESGCHISQNIIVRYDKNDLINRTTGENVTGPHPGGMSGCGLWFFPIQMSDCGVKEKKLVGILTKWYKRNYWIATRIDVFTEIVRRKYHIDIRESTFIPPGTILY